VPLSCQTWSNRLARSLRRSAGLGSACQKRPKFLGTVEVGVGWWRESLQLFLEGLAAHDVAGLDEVAEDVEVLQPVELCKEVAAALRLLGVLLGGRADRVQDKVAQLGVGLEGVKPGDDLVLQRLGLDDGLVAVAVVASGGALLAADAGA
jgi:hypothetical protein